MTSNALVGTWRLVSHVYTSEDGDTVHPWGDAGGYIMYGADGYMSVVISDRDRPNFASGDVKGGTIEERAAAASSYVSYCGRYELKEDHVVHHIEAALFPNRVGTQQVRYFTLAGDTLSLRTAPMLVEGKVRVGELVWERVESGLPSPQSSPSPR